MHHHYMAFLYVLLSCCILTCITITSHSYMRYYYITSHSYMRCHYITFAFFQTLPCIPFSPEKLISFLLSRKYQTVYSTRVQNLKDVSKGYRRASAWSGTFEGRS